MQSLRTLEHLFHSPLVAHATIDGAGLIRSSNPAFARFTRYSTQELEGLPFSVLLQSPLPDATADVPTRLCFRASDGRLLWGDACLFPLSAVDDTSDGFLLQVCDRTRSHLDQQLHKGRAQVLELLYRDHSLPEICETIVRYIEALGEGVRCSILLLDAERSTLHKAAAPSLPDFYSDAIEGMRIGDGVGSCGTAVFRRERVIVADILSHPYWQRARRLIERTPMRACWSEPIVAHDGNVLGSFALYYDTPREPQADELDLINSAASLTAIAISYKRSEQVLRDLDRAKDEFISTAAHELRTPLTAIMGYADLLLAGGYDSALQREFVSEIYGRGEALERLIADLLDVSLIQVGRGLAFEIKPVRLLPIVHRVVGHFQHKSPLHQIQLRCGGGLPEVISCDAGRMTQVLENLLSNAIKYSPQGSPIVLEVQQVGSMLQFCVSDQGVGMTEDELRHVFDKFYRVNASTTAPRGLGLGLCIVRQIIEGHGGEIVLKSRPQEGTRVSFSLPL
jgi:PAS domain S-box-containing protein